MKKILFILFIYLSAGFALAQKMNIATYNLRYANINDSVNGNGWEQRSPVLAQLIRFHDFDIFGTQEGLYSQLKELTAMLPGYKYIGVGRDDGVLAGEHSAIFYKDDKFEVIKQGNFWLSEIMDRPNKGWDAVLPRICTWGEFKEKKTGIIFLFFNLHLDHVGVKARSESVKLIMKQMKELDKDVPAILTGDFNIDQYNEAYYLLSKSGILYDAYDLADFRYETNGTFNDFQTDTKTNSRIDHIFLTPNFKVEKYGILTDTYRIPVNSNGKPFNSGNFPKEVSLIKYQARTPSDHFPVMIEVSYK